jgi:diguanylate cyclase (GGDEF)-like protein/PAS domain S-box-containing protein
MNQPSRLADQHPWLWVLLMTLLFAAAAMFSLGLPLVPGKGATLWFANAIGTVALLALPWKYWPAMLSSLWLANASAYLYMALTTKGWGPQLWLDVTASLLANGAEMLLAAALLRHMASSGGMLRQPGQFGRALMLGALLPTFWSSWIAAALLSHAGQAFALSWAHWFTGNLIGNVSMLPLVLSFWQHPKAPLMKLLGNTRTLALLLLSIGISLAAAALLPRPFVIVAIALVLVAVQSSFVITALATLLTAVMLELLRTYQILPMPPATAWWTDLLFYSSFLASLLPGLFLASSVEGQTQAMRQLLASEQRFRSLYARTPAMMHSIDPEGRILSVSELWLQTLGYEEHEVLGRHTTEFMTPETARYAREVVIPQAKRNGRCDNVDYQMRARDGRVLDVLLSAVWLYDKEGQPLSSLAVLQDVTEKKRLQALSYYAAHDPLTGLPNRVLLQDRLERSCVQHTRHGTRFAIGFLDLDHFKDVNDTYGHDAGDLLLKRVARRLLTALRASDTVCRLAGDEFVLLFADVEQTADLHALVQKILASLAQPFRLGEDPQAPVVSVAASMGLALCPEHGTDPQTLLAHADQAMYSAKRGGRGRSEFYRPKVTPRT